MKVTPSEQLTGKDTNAITITGNNATLDGVTVEGVTTSAANPKTQPVYMVTVNGSNPTVRNNTFNGSTDGKVYSLLRIGQNASENVVIEGNTFKGLENVYNVIEFDGGYKADNNLVIKSNKISKNIIHNGISLYDFEANANVVLEDNEINGMRISNYSGNPATIEFRGGKAVFNDDYEEEYGFLTIQQTNNNQDYKNMTIKVNGFKKEDDTRYTENSGTGKELFASFYSNNAADNVIPEEQRPTINFIA